MRSQAERYNSARTLPAVVHAHFTQKVYLASLTIALVGAIVAGTAHSVGVLIGTRCLQAAG